MKLSTNFVKDYVDIDVDVNQLAEDMTRVGNEYDSAEKLINATKLVIGEIVECKEHPDSDHLHLCKVNIFMYHFYYGLEYSYLNYYMT